MLLPLSGAVAEVARVTVYPSFSPALGLRTDLAPAALELADLNGDARLDAIAADGDSMISILLNDGSGGFGAKTSIPVGQSPSNVASGDFTGDGKRDLAVTYFNRVVVLPGNGLGGFGTPLTSIGTVQNLSLDVGDVNEDGLLDVAVGQGGPTFSTAYGRGDGTFGPFIASSIGTDPEAIRLVDLDGNGTLDAVSANNGSSSLGVALGRQKTRTALSVTPEWSPIGSDVTYTATVTEARPDPNAPTDSIRFFDGFVRLGTAPLVNGVATLVLPATRPWHRTITAEYKGDAHFFGSLSRPVPHQNIVPTVGVEPLATPSLALVSTRNPSFGGTLPVRLTLPATTTAHLTVYDVRGRLVAHSEVTRSHPGTYAVDAVPGRRLPPGLYLVRLSQSSRSAVTRAVVL
jgi:Bacterial Ig-like domain (group 3)/FG-GAP-like repeat